MVSGEAQIHQPGIRGRGGHGLFTHGFTLMTATDKRWKKM
jgi:hypothetical protein